MTIVIGQWAYLSVPLEGPNRTLRFKQRWMPPAGRGPRVDLRPLPAQASSSTIPQGFGLFVIDGPAPPGTLDLGTSLLQPLSTDQRRNFEGMFNLADGDLDAPTLGDAVWRLMTELADPTGANQAPPIMPKADGLMRLRIGGARREEKYDPAKHPHVLTVARAAYAKNAAREDFRNRELEAKGVTRQQIKQGVMSRYLAGLARKLGVRPQDIAVPSGGAIFGDTFVEATDTALGSHTPTGSNAGSGWTVMNGTWLVEAANDVAYQTTVTDPGSSRLVDDLDSDDMISYHGVFSFGTFRAAGPLARYSSSAEDYYGYSRDNSNSFSHELFKVVGGTATSLADPTDDFQNPYDHTELRLIVDGSDLEGLEDSVSQVTVTDTSITGNLRGGIYSDESAANTGMQFADYTVEDISGAQTVSLSATVLSLDAPAMTPTGSGSATVALSPASLSLDAVAVTPSLAGSPQSVALSPAALSLDAPAITPGGTGSATVAMSPAALSLVAPAITPDAGTVSVALSPAALALVAPSMTPSGSGSTSVALDPAILSLIAVSMSPAGSGSASIGLSPAVLSLAAAALTPAAIATLNRITTADARFRLIATGKARYAEQADANARYAPQAEAAGRYSPTATGQARKGS